MRLLVRFCIKSHMKIDMPIKQKNEPNIYEVHLINKENFS